MRTEEIETRTLEEQPTAVRRATLAPEEMPNWFSTAYGEIASFLGRHGVRPAGMPFARYHRRSDGRFDTEAGFPIAAPVTGDGMTEASTLPGGPAAVTLYRGPYDGLAAAYEQLEDWLRTQGGIPDGDPWEVYFDPPTGDPADWRTEVIQPYRPAGSLA
ncbi:MAG TPA: GyrI-like domain-containing protein [Kribbella sp.]|nr:GyrI-like domain-containing protein [Kribbella sp.]